MFKVTPGRVALGPRPLHLSPGFSAVGCFRVGWGEQERYRASEPTAVDSGGLPPYLCLTSDGPSAMSPRRIIL